MKIAEYQQVDVKTVKQETPILDEHGMETGEFETVEIEVPVMGLITRDATKEEEAQALASDELIAKAPVSDSEQIASLQAEIEELKALIKQMTMK